MSLIGNIIGTLGNFIARIDKRYERSLNMQELRSMRMIQLGDMPVYPDAKMETFVDALFLRITAYKLNEGLNLPRL